MGDQPQGKLPVSLPKNYLNGLIKAGFPFLINPQGGFGSAPTSAAAGPAAPM
jgi:uncharacterized protein (DUF3820 family)